MRNDACQHAPCNFAELEEHHGALLRFLRRRVRDENDVQDLAQEALLRGARYRYSHVEPHRLRGWLIRIAANLQADLKRRRQNEPATLGDTFLFEEQGPTVAEEPSFAWGGIHLPWTEALEHLRSALAGLPHGDRRVLTGFYGRGARTIDLARESGVPISLIKVRLFRARQKLREGVEQRLRGILREEWGWAG